MRTRFLSSAVLLLALLHQAACRESPSGAEEALERPADDASRSLASLRKVDDHPLYVMHYYGGYDLGRVLQGNAQMGDPSRPWWGCTCFAALNGSGDAVLGRNFDWYDHPTLILFTHPFEGNASVSMVDISYLGFGREEPSEADRRRLLDAPYLPFDGMNERGLAVGMMAVPYANGGADPEKPTIGSLYAIRLMLDLAKDVDQAVVLLQDYNIDFSGGPPIHYLVSDASGNAAVVEFLDEGMNVLRAEETWQVATNFVLSDTPPEKANCWRYDRACAALGQTDGKVAEAMDLLKEVSQENTIWSIVYNATTGDIQVAMGKKYRQVHRFELEMGNQ